LTLLPLFILAHFSHHLVAALITPLLPYIRDSFSLSYTRAGVLVSAFILSYGIGQLPGGWLGDKLGCYILITIGISGVALCGLLIGLSVNFIMIAFCLVLMGILGGGYHPSASPLISTLVSPEYRGRALGIHQIGGTASYFLAPLIAVGIANALRWQDSFIILSIPTFIYGITFYILLKRWGVGKEGSKDKSNDEQISRKDKTPLRHLITIIIMNVCVQIFLFSAVSFIPFYVVDNFSGSEKASAALLSLTHSAGLWAGPLGGYLSDRLGKIPVVVATGIIAGPLIYLLNHVSLGWSIAVVLLFIGMTQYMSMPVTESYVITHSPERNRSTILGIYYFASRGGPGLLTPVIGYLIDNFSFYTAYSFTGAGMSFIAVICTLLILVRKKSKQK
jgi:FSR family fosmidomycin resistance protein-like MFS transporter